MRSLKHKESGSRTGTSDPPGAACAVRKTPRGIGSLEGYARGGRIGSSHGVTRAARQGRGELTDGQEELQRCGRRSRPGEPLRATAGVAVDGGAPPVALDVELEDRGAVHQPVDGSDGHGGVGEDLVPLSDRLVGGDQQGALLVTRADQLEQDAGLGLVSA